MVRVRQWSQQHNGRRQQRADTYGPPVVAVHSTDTRAVPPIPIAFAAARQTGRARKAYDCRHHREAAVGAITHFGNFGVESLTVLPTASDAGS